MSWLKMIQFVLMMMFISATAFAGIEDVNIDLQLLNPNAQIFVVGDFRSTEDILKAKNC